jgi:hypothetical protein
MESSAKGEAVGKPPRWRRITPWVLIVVATIIAIAAAMNVWAKRQALDTDNWVATSSQLLENDEIRQALSVYLVDQLYSNVDVKTELQQELPPNLQGLAAPLSSALQVAAVRVMDELLSRPRVQEAWKAANRRAHKLFIAVIDDKGERLQTTNGKVVLDLRPLVEQLSQRQGIVGQAAQKLPPDAGQLVIMDSKQLGAAQTAVRVIKVLSYFLAILALALYALAVYLGGRGHRRANLMGVGFAILFVGVLILAVRRFAGDWVVDALTKNPSFKDATKASWSISTHLLRNAAVGLVVYGAVIVVGAWLAGPSRAATAVRRWLAPTLRERPIVVYAVVTLGLLVFLITGPTDSSRLIPLLILFGFAYLGVEIFRRQAAKEFPESA